MKKILLLAVFGATTLLGACQSQPISNNTSFGANSAQTMSVAQAKNLHNDAFVSLEGHIVAQVGDEKYTFKDHSGEITVEIDHDKWLGLNVSPTDTVMIYGEVDKEWSGTQIDVKRITKK
ncbi:hypothetical protein A4G19_07535 [Pasteurellaceae bacterium Macca]|nr:hypothetical protein [Pasteurellaceae bacterium Macca]